MGKIERVIRLDKKIKEMLTYANKSFENIKIEKINEKNIESIADKVNDFLLFISALKEPCCTINRAIKIKRKIEKRIEERMKGKFFNSSYTIHSIDENDYIAYL